MKALVSSSNIVSKVASLKYAKDCMYAQEYLNKSF